MGRPWGRPTVVFGTLVRRMTILALTVLGLLGLVVGSFLNVVAHRVPAGASIVAPGSACPACGHPIRPRDNIPVLGWLLLRGRCRDCGTAISARYPIVEAFTGVAFATTGAVLGPVWVLPAYLWFVAVTIVLTLIDLDHKLIPNRVLYPGTVVGVLLLAGGAVVDGRPGSLLVALASGAGFFLTLLVLALVARGGFGFGDVKLGFLLGVFTGYLGWPNAVVAFVAAFLYGGLVSVVLLVTRLRGRKDAIPFGPYLVAGAYTAVVLGERVVAWYLR